MSALNEGESHEAHYLRGRRRGRCACIRVNQVSTDRDEFFSRTTRDGALRVLADQRRRRSGVGLIGQRSSQVKSNEFISIWMEDEMEGLLTAIVLWLSSNFTLPANFDHPRVEFVSATEMAALLPKDEQSSIASIQSTSEILSLYNNETKTIFLLDGWQGKTPAELSIVVHEMVHHLQNVGQLKFACPQEREELAYLAQERWLKLFGRDLLRDFQMDSFTILVKSRCPY
jgi:uncharacterized protein DUF6647